MSIKFRVFRGFAKGWFPKGWFWRMFPRNENRNEGTFAKTTLLETALLSPAVSLLLVLTKGWFPKGWFRRMFPRNENRNEGTFAKTTLLRNRPFISRSEFLFFFFGGGGGSADFIFMGARIFLRVPKLGCFKPGCLQLLRPSALLCSFAPFALFGGLAFTLTQFGKGPCHIKNTTVILIHYGGDKKYDGRKTLRQGL